MCLSVSVFVCVQRRASDDSFSLNNIKRRCEMISDAACCLSLSSVSDYQDLVVLSGEHCGGWRGENL